MIYFRVDGTKDIGMGHIFRCISLAKELSSSNDIIFFIEKSNKSRELVVSKGFAVAAPEHFEDFSSWDNKKKVVITDIIESETIEKWLKTINSKRNDIFHIGIHDQGLNQFQSDIIIDGSVVNSKPYPKNKEMVYLLGKEYMIINPKFETLHHKQKKYPDKISNILLFFGGSDPSNITEIVGNKLAESFPQKAIYAIAGPESEILSKSFENYHNVKILKGLKDISELIHQCDIIVCSGGIILFEAACLGTPSIAINHDKFQDQTASFFHKKGITINLGLFKKLKIDELINTIISLDQNPQMLNSIGSKGKEFIDGKGVYRIKEFLENLL